MKKKTHKRHFWKKMRFRIILSMVLIGVIPFPLLFYYAIHTYEERITDFNLSSLAGHEHVLADRLSEGFYWNKQNEQLNQLLIQHANEAGGRTMVMDQSCTILFDSYGAELPAITKSLIAVSNFFTKYWMVMLGIGIAIFTERVLWRCSGRVYRHPS